MEDARRKFMRRMADAAMGTAVAPLGAFYSSGANAADCEAGGLRTRGFGPLRSKQPVNAADLGDIASGQMVNREFLAIPDGFSYKVISGLGQEMTDGTRVPGNMDGMAAYQVKTRRVNRRGEPIYKPMVHLVRNHEISPGDNTFGVPGVTYRKPWGVYDRKSVAGGTTTIWLDSRNLKVRRQFVSLAGTLRNCGGGRTPWNTWVSCEEDVSNQLDNGDVVARPHGYAFEVKVFGTGRPTRPIPLRSLGRFRREAVAIDPVTTTVFQTEDRSNSCFYAFVPRKKIRRFGHLRRGGTVFAMRIVPNQRATCDNSALPITVVDGTRVVDTSKNMQSFVGQSLKVEWVEIPNPNPVKDSVRTDAQKLGATIFNRGEGMVFDDQRRVAYFCATHGGDAGTGQIWAYDMRTQTVKLVIESSGQRYLDSPDNIVLGPDGTLYINEDSSRRSHVMGLTPQGRLFRMARNVFDRGEMAGICFSPDGKLMFVNIQAISLTCCIYRDDGQRIVL